MPTIYDNIDTRLLCGLRRAAEPLRRLDACVGYFNLHGWAELRELVDQAECCRLIVGMHRPQDPDLLTRAERPTREQESAERRRWAASFRQQLTSGMTDNTMEAALGHLAKQLQSERVKVGLHVRYPLHAKLYLLHRRQHYAAATGFVGSSNLTRSGLLGQGELNIDVNDQDATGKLQGWFDDRWADSVDITKQLLDVLTEVLPSEPRSPFHIYLKMAYHLSEEARRGEEQFAIPQRFRDRLLPFQVAAVKLAARHVQARGGVLLGDVVGLGKTIMASALAGVFRDHEGWQPLVICPKNLTGWWAKHLKDHALGGEVLSISQVVAELPDKPAYRLVIIDESHNLRNRTTQTYQAIEAYLRRFDCRVVLLSATPYNKAYLDLANQLRLFVGPDSNLGLRPEHQIREDGGEQQFRKRSGYNGSLWTLEAFEQSAHPEDWRELMRRYMVRRTRGFVLDEYGQPDDNGQRFLPMPGALPLYFARRQARTIKFALDETNDQDQYARLYAGPVVDALNALNLPRYGLANYVVDPPPPELNDTEQKTLRNLSRAGAQLKGFTRTGLFKRLESSGDAFLRSVGRHLLRNLVVLHALSTGQPVPIGPQDVATLEASARDGDIDADDAGDTPPAVRTSTDLAQRTYDSYVRKPERFDWLPAALFSEALRDDLKADCQALRKIVDDAGQWDAAHDTKLQALRTLLTETHAGQKVLVFSEFADTVGYLERELQNDVTEFAAVTGSSGGDPTDVARRFSPCSNGHELGEEPELHVLVATDVLSEGQNLQDAAIVVNYDLPWGIIPLIQRAGRVDRLGQTAAEVRCYSFLPAEGVERILDLRGRVRQRLRDNQEVMGSDEVFFPDDVIDSGALRGLYDETQTLDDPQYREDPSGLAEVDLASYAHAIWQTAIAAGHSSERDITGLPDQVHTARRLPADAADSPGVLLYVRSAAGADHLAYLDPDGGIRSQSPRQVLDLAACARDAQGHARADWHHAAVAAGKAALLASVDQPGAYLGGASTPGHRTYRRLTRFLDEVRRQPRLPGADPIDTAALDSLTQELAAQPLSSIGREALSAALRLEDDHEFAKRCVALRKQGALFGPADSPAEAGGQERILCSLGLLPTEG